MWIFDINEVIKTMQIVSNLIFQMNLKNKISIHFQLLFIMTYKHLYQLLTLFTNGLSKYVNVISK